MDPAEIELAPKNARFMPPPMFARLVKNIEQDKHLASAPLCILREGKTRVVSGNHRVQAAVAAKIPTIIILRLRGEVSRSREVSIQLSHNALTGVDDPGRLAELYREITDLESLQYTGVPVELVDRIEKDLSMPSSVPLDVRVVVLAFTPHEVGRAREIFERIDQAPAPEVAFGFPIEHWQAFLAATEVMRRKRNIISPSTAVMKLLAIAERWFQEHPEEDLSVKGKNPAAAGKAPA